MDWQDGILVGLLIVTSALFGLAMGLALNGYGG